MKHVRPFRVPAKLCRRERTEREDPLPGTPGILHRASDHRGTGPSTPERGRHLGMIDHHQPFGRSLKVHRGRVASGVRDDVSTAGGRSLHFDRTWCIGHSFHDFQGGWKKRSREVVGPDKRCSRRPPGGNQPHRRPLRVPFRTFGNAIQKLMSLGIPPAIPTPTIAIDFRDISPLFSHMNITELSEVCHFGEESGS